MGSPVGAQQESFDPIIVESARVLAVHYSAGHPWMLLLLPWPHCDGPSPWPHTNKIIVPIVESDRVVDGLVYVIVWLVPIRLLLNHTYDWWWLYHCPDHSFQCPWLISPIESTMMHFLVWTWSWWGSIVYNYVIFVSHLTVELFVATSHHHHLHVPHHSQQIEHIRRQYRTMKSFHHSHWD